MPMCTQQLSSHLQQTRLLASFSVMLTVGCMGQVGPPKVPENFMAPITAVPNAKAGDKARVEAILTELPEEVTAALIKK